MFELSFDVKKATVLEPKFLIVYSKPKVGKTNLLMNLPNSLLVDLENGADFYDGNSFNVPKIAKQNNMHQIKVLNELAKKID